MCQVLCETSKGLDNCNDRDVMVNKRDALPTRTMLDVRQAAHGKPATTLCIFQRSTRSTMSIRNLDFMFKPRSIAVIGASNRTASVGAVLTKNLFAAGFDGPIMPVNPKHRTIQGRDAYRDVSALPSAPDLAVICTPPQSVPGIIADLARLGTRAAVIITAGFAERGDEPGRVLQQAVLDAAQPALLRVVGPNCLGIMVPKVGLNASFSHLAPKHGPLAFVTQSGAIVTSVLDWAAPRGIGFSHMVSLGDMADVDFGDMLDYLANDRDTHAILLYIEAVTNARKFLSAARAAARLKPVVVVKAGRHAEGARAAASHTGALAGADAVYDTVFRRAGMLRVHGLDELFDAVEVLAMGQRPKGDRLAIVTNGGGIGVLATDALMDHSGHLAMLSPDTMLGLNKVLPPTWSHANPVDIIGDASGERYAAALDVLLIDKQVDAVLVLNCPTAVASSSQCAEAVIDAHKRHPGRTLLTSWVGDATTGAARRAFTKQQIPTFDTPGQAIRGFMYLVEHARRQATLMETPPSIPEDFTPDRVLARSIIDAALLAKRQWLSELEAKEVLAAYGVPIVTSHIASTAQQAGAIAAQIDAAVALKILSDDITHKSDVGGVVLNLLGPVAVCEAALAMSARVKERQPSARLSGFTVAPMVHRPGAHELILGVTTDPQFGPVVLFGHGGTAAELINDKALGLPPLNMNLAREIIARTRVARLLHGYRDRPAANLDAIAMALIRVAQLASDFAEIIELDINPLLADENGVVALDARIKVQASSELAVARLCILPYPKELEEDVLVGDARQLLLRPIRPEDELALRAAFDKLDADEVRRRFFMPMKTLSHVQAARLTQIDYDREMALLLTERGGTGPTTIYGVVRIAADPDNERAEFAIIVTKAMTGMGLGTMLMRKIIGYSRERGIGEIFGEVLRENEPMLKLCTALGFTKSFVVDEHSIVRVTLRL